jgi:hypothetical protein
VGEQPVYEIEYVQYNPGQYAAEFARAVQERIAAGWRVLQADLNYNEVYMLWHRGDHSMQSLVAEAPEEPEEETGEVSSAVAEGTSPGAGAEGTEAAAEPESKTG